MNNHFYLLILGIISCFIETLFPIPKSNISIEQSIKSISQTVPGIFGISALHLESGKWVELNAHQRFPMASTYKIPIAIYFLSLVDSGKIDLQHKHRVTEEDIRRFCFISPGQCLSNKELSKLMIENSDNATSDIILKMVGGGNAVTQWFHNQNIHEINIDRSTLQMTADYSGISSLGNEDLCTPQNYEKLLKNISKKQSLLAVKRFYTDQRDTVTPHTMVNILVQLYQGKLLSQSSTNFLLSSMSHYTRGKKRIPFLLPKKTKVWHKSGTVDGMVSDVGIVKLPNNAGHLVLAIYANKSVTHMKQREIAIARITKKLFDHFSQKNKV